MNSVEPVATSPTVRRLTSPVFPFSVQGVIRANNVSPLVNLEPPLPTVRVRTVLTSRVLVGSDAISTNGARVLRVIGRRGFTSTASENAIVCHGLLIPQLPHIPVHRRLRRRTLLLQFSKLPHRLSYVYPSLFLGGVHVAANVQVPVILLNLGQRHNPPVLVHVGKCVERRCDVHDILVPQAVLVAPLLQLP